MLASAQGSVKSALAPSFLIFPPYHTPSLTLCACVCLSVCARRVIEVCDLAVGLAGVKGGMEGSRG